MEHGSLETKLVALGVAHDRPSVPRMLAELDELRAPTNEPRHRALGIAPDTAVSVDARKSATTITDQRWMERDAIA